MSWMTLLQPEAFTDVELFAGAGGLAIGLRAAGFGPGHLFESDPHACATLRHNLASGSPTLAGEVHPDDVKAVNWTRLARPVRLLAAGAPCQPFSLAGRHKADQDDRNLFPEVLRAVRELRPAAVLIENVRGLLRSPLTPYFDYVRRQLECPSLKPRKDESWQKHDQRLRRQQCAVGYAPEYLVAWRLLDAADYGAAQNRRRVFVVATRIELPAYRFPSPSHSRDALVGQQSSGAYWEQRSIPKPKDWAAPCVDQVQSNGHLPWVTVRDALQDLPEPASSADGAVMNHWRIEGARHYTGHSGSALDWPSKTIKAGVHGVPGGENTLIDDTGKLRYYTLREAARVQGFPDSHFFTGARIHITRQIGNAVPCILAEHVAKPLFDLLQRAMTGSRRTNDTASDDRASV